MITFDTAVVGGGAAGMIAALQLARKGLSVALLEQNDRLGKKIAVSGNGQGNLTNVRLAPKYYHGAVTLATGVIKQYGYAACAEFYESVGCLLAEGKDGRIYPTSYQANSVVDNLRNALLDCDVQVFTGARVDNVYYRGNSWVVRAGENDCRAKTVLLAFGGAASPSLGTDGSSFALARALGHSVVPLRPSLVQLQTDRAFLKGLKGVKVDAAVVVESGGKTLAQARGDVLFTDYGVSGNAVFAVSGYALQQKSTLHLTFLPDVSPEKLTEALTAKTQRMPYLVAEELFSGIVPKQVGRSILRHLGISPITRLSDLSASISAIVRAVKDIPLAVTGSTGLGGAQVTKGGIPERELTEALESRAHSGLFFAGEAIDVDGDCGGFNLHWAFASASAVAAEITKRLSK